MKRVFITAVAVAALTTIFQACKKDDSDTPEQKTVNVYGLFSLTGNWSSLGITSQAALSLAVDDINTELAAKHASFKLAATVYDTKLDVELAKGFFTQAKSDNVRFVVGPQSSAEVAGIKPLSDAADIILISQGSTAGSLAIAGDNIFRFCPGDKIEGAAMAATIDEKGIKGIVTVARDDAGNKGLQSSTGASFKAKGGKVDALSPYATTLTDYTPVIAAIKTKLNSLIATYGKANVGVYIASFDEGTEIFKLAAADPVLSSVKWFGGDGVVLSTAYLSNATVANFVIKTHFFAPSFGLPVATQAKWKPVAARIKTITGTDPDAFALVAYDAMWTIAHTLEASHGSTADFAKIKELFVKEANTHNGIVGPETLDAAGDRANGTFDYFSIVKDGSTYVWKLVGKSH